MQKLALSMTVTTLVAGAFGAFLRWLQLRTIYDAETGLPRPWAGISIIFVIYILAFAIALIGIIIFRLRIRIVRPLTAERALRACTPIPSVLVWLFCGAFAAGGLVLLFSQKSAVTQMENILGTLFRAGCIIAGSCVLCLPWREGKESAFPGRLGSVVLTVFFCVWLIHSYLENSRDPISWNYLPELLSVTASTMGFYYITAYYFGRAKPRSAVFWSFFAALLNICTIFDLMTGAEKILHAATAGTLLLMGFLIVENMRKVPVGPSRYG